MEMELDELRLLNFAQNLISLTLSITLQYP